jgi:succinate dehydrogenase / fumarate reductase iron-sulfur subunit
MSTESENVRDIVFRIRRYDPARDSEPYLQDFTVPVPHGMVVLDGLWYIKEKLDPSLSWRSSCRMGVCGSCGMLINGKPTLACNTQILDVCSDTLMIAPLPNFDIVRDLVPDLQPMFERHADLQPFVRRADISGTENPTDQFWQSQEDLEKYLQFSYCIKCGCCMAACPVVATDEVYSGPQPLSQAYRYMIDSRNDDFRERKERYAREVGPWRCHYAGECSAVCPKGVDPARAIQLMKRELVLDYLRLGKLRKREAAPLMPADNKLGRREGIPEPPPFTVEGAG